MSNEQLAKIELLRELNDDGEISLFTRAKYINKIVTEEDSPKCQTCDGEKEIPSRNFSPNNPNLIDIPYVRCPSCHGSGIES